jgi:hypothetical protein
VISERTIIEIATENVVEGCVREAFGAVVAKWRSLHAEDLELRRAMVRIAREEARHASLAIQIDAWLFSRLNGADRVRVRAARANAVAELHNRLPSSNDGTTARALGVPNRQQAVAMLDEMFS